MESAGDHLPGQGCQAGPRRCRLRGQGAGGEEGGGGRSAGGVGDPSSKILILAWQARVCRSFWPQYFTRPQLFVGLGLGWF